MPSFIADSFSQGPLAVWWQLLAVGGLAVLLVLVVIRAVWPVALRLSRHSTVLGAVVARLGGPLRWLLPLIALQLVWQAAPDDLARLGSVQHLNGVLLILALTTVAIAAVRGTADAMVVLHPQDVADNLEARRILTQTRVLSRIAIGVIIFAGVAFALMTFPRARQLGASLLASAGVSALVIGIAARSVVGNLLAGLQIALSQPIRIDDVLIIESEWGRVEEITGTYVVMKIWDERRLVIPLQWFIEHPFQNWTRSSSQLIGSVFFWVDYRCDLEPLRAEAARLAQTSKDYDGRVCLLQVVETSETAMQLRLIISSPSAGQSWDLRCLLREGLIAHLQRTQPEALPRTRAEVVGLPPRRPLPGGATSVTSPPSPSPSSPSTPPPPPPAAGLAAGNAGEAAAAVVNNDTGMAILAAPTGGVRPAAGAPK